jgi:hypothetical protein
MADWHARNAERLHLPRLYALDDVIRAFAEVGFQTAAARLKMGFVPMSSHAPSFPAGLEYFYDHKVMLRFKKPALYVPSAKDACSERSALASDR